MLRKVFKEQAKTKNEVKGEASAPQLQNLLKLTHGDSETGIDNFGLHDIPSGNFIAIQNVICSGFTH